MKILMLSQGYPPILGGLEQHVRNLSLDLVKRGHEVSVATLWHEGQSEQEDDQGVRVYRLRGSIHRAAKFLFVHPGRRYVPPFPDPELVLNLRHVIRDEQPEIVHAHNWMVYSFLPLKTWSKAKLVLTLHDFGHRCVCWNMMWQNRLCSGPRLERCLSCAANQYGFFKGSLSFFANAMMSAALRQAADLFIPVSHAVAAGNQLLDRGLPVQVIPNFLPDRAASESSGPQVDLDAYVSQLPDEPYLLFVGAFTRQKGLDVLLQAYAQLDKAPILVLIGYETSDYRPEIDQFNNRVRVFTNWPHAAVMEAWGRSMLGLIPSIGPESCPTVAMEAMISGRPVIASDIGGIPDLIEKEVNGLLVPPGNPTALAEAIQRLAADPDLRQRMGDRGSQKIAKFQANQVVSQIEAAYLQLRK